MSKCVYCGKEMVSGYSIIDNEIFCPDCAEKHPTVVASRERREKEKLAVEIRADALWKLSAGECNETTVRGKKITKEEFIEAEKRRR